MRWSETWQHVIRAAVDWFFRPRGPEKWIFAGGVAVLIVLNTANVYLNYKGPIGSGQGSVDLGTTGSVPVAIYWTLTLLGVLLTLGSVTWAWKRYRDEQRLLSRKKVFVIEARGLRDDAGASLEQAIPNTIAGTRTPWLMDVRQRRDGAIVEPEALLSPVQTMKGALHQWQRSQDRADLAVVYGGLAAVPVTFLTGVLLDDEGPITVMDWDRQRECWRGLDGEDDGVRFDVSGVDGIVHSNDVVLAVSVSYLVKNEDLLTSFGHPVVRMTMAKLDSSHWSDAKQGALGAQFLAVLKDLDAKGVRQIHLVLAAQNSVVFNLGRQYDKRNLPPVAVYQFERGQEPRYPWAIQMPVAGVDDARVVRTHLS